VVSPWPVPGRPPDVRGAPANVSVFTQAARAGLCSDALGETLFMRQ
jgi:hypothetical protein